MMDTCWLFYFFYFLNAHVTVPEVEIQGCVGLSGDNASMGFIS